MQPFHARMLLALVLPVLLLGACTFGGYVPKGPPPKPLAETEANIAELALGERRHESLSCDEGICRVRFRMVVPGPGELTVLVDAPVGEGTGTGPRVGRVVLEGVGQRSLATALPDEVAGQQPLTVSSKVKPGVHFVLIQGLGGAFEYDLEARFEAEKAETVAATAPGPEAGTESTAGAGSAPPSVGKLPPSRSGQAPGDTSDGADFAYDPSRDLAKLERYAFAQDPAAILKGEPGSVHGDPFVEKQIQREIRYFLADMGIYDAPANEADFLISIQVGAYSTTYHTINAEIFENAYDFYFDAWRRQGLYIQRHTYVDGTLLIDFIDPKTGHLLWHGWTTEPVKPSAGDDSILRTAVRNVLSQF